nr:6393_t:CDS:2 [Entrophospora candida]
MRLLVQKIEYVKNVVQELQVPNSSEHHYWSEFGHRFFSRALQEFVDVIKSEAKNNVTAKHDNDTIQILKRKFDEITQTKQSPLKIAKR